MPLIAKFKKDHKKASIRLKDCQVLVSYTNHGNEVATFEASLFDKDTALAKAREYVYGA
jgi:hypothetical protein